MGRKAAYCPQWADIPAASRSSDRKLILAIADRAAREYRADPLSTQMDILATHTRGCPLRLEDLLNAEGFNFVHDVGGIRTHLDRSTGELTGCFLPRFAQPDFDADDSGAMDHTLAA